MQGWLTGKRERAAYPMMQFYSELPRLHSIAKSSLKSHDDPGALRFARLALEVPDFALTPQVSYKESLLERLSRIA